MPRWFINKPDSSSDLTIFIISFISLLEIKNVVLPDPSVFLWIVTSVAAAAAVSPNGIKTLLANGLSAFPIKGNSVFSNGLKILPKNSPDCPNFILADKSFVKALRSFKTCVLVNNNLCEKLFSSLESSKTFDEIFEVASVPFLILDLIY